ncbi:VOC family protein [Kutzneria buriramensis]|uniref:Catechol 2,3-dioxygenase-like lactoylglutathione lyase family enzyme n=1 Tax=Kutzneria buriramensis TaxID=1045776 RepID=A0A3E0HB54_9PSEU|nr:VOC family protein [Kutzneria buriramensis]REH41128.1 catechol 2,3-dioxygenase-like lactoylglutathione lyase family enzyme [Kutzneria buriramensis]
MHPNSDGAFAGVRPNMLVANVDASLRFYADVLGFRIGWRWSDPEGRFLDADEPGPSQTAQVGRDKVLIIFTQKPGPHTTWLHLDVNSAAQVDELFREWTGRGAVIAEPPSLRAWGMYEMRVHDPDGNVLRVSSYPTDR